MKSIFSILLCLVNLLLPANLWCNKVQTQVAGIYKLGQTPEELLSALAEENITLYPSLTDEPEGRVTEWDDYFWYNSQNIEAHFNPQGRAVSIYVKTDKYATDLDVKVGDSKTKILEVYGTKYKQSKGNENYYYYARGKLCIGFLVEEDTVLSWGIFLRSVLQRSEP